MPVIEFPPLLIGAGGFLCAEHGVGRYDEKHCDADGVFGPLGFGLGVLECVDVLGNYLTLDMVMLHLILQCE